MPREKSPQVMNLEVLESLRTKILSDIVKAKLIQYAHAIATANIRGSSFSVQIDC